MLKKMKLMEATGFSQHIYKFGVALSCEEFDTEDIRVIYK